MPETIGKTHKDHDIGLDDALIIKFQPVVVSNTLASTVVQDSLALPTNLKILKVSAVQHLATTPATVGVNLVYGTVAPTGAPPAYSYQTAPDGPVVTKGVQVLAQEMSVATADICVEGQAAVIDAIWPNSASVPVSTNAAGGQPLTLRITAASPVNTTLNVMALAKPFDINRAKYPELIQASTGKITI